MEELKGLDDICSPDARNAAMRLRNNRTGAIRPYTVADVHASLEDAELGDAVPGDIRDHFQTARHLVLYSWFVYRFIPVAQMQAYGSLEFALRERLDVTQEKRPPGLKQLIRKATSLGLLSDKGFRDWPGHRTGVAREETSPSTWVERALTEYLPHFRNNLAHGSVTLMPDGGRTLRIVADAINQLYRVKAE
jgi:hypothetical protein